MSTLTVTSINTANGSVDVTLGTGNTSGPKIIAYAANGNIDFANTVLTAQGVPLDVRGGSNHTITASVGSSALTVAVKTIAGADATATSTIPFRFRNATAATGDVTQVNLAAAQSIVISSGSTTGATSATAFRLWLVQFNDAGTLRLGLINCLSGTNIYPLRDNVLASSTAEGGAGAADSAHVIYTGTAVTTKAYRILAYLEWSSGLTTAGTWDAVPTTIQLFNQGDKMPGDRLQSVCNASGSLVTGTTVVPLDDTLPQITEGDEYLSQAITPTSKANVLRISIQACLSSTTAVRWVTSALFQDSTANAIAVTAQYYASAQEVQAQSIEYWMLARTVSSTTFRGRAGPSSSGTWNLNGIGDGRLFGGTMNSYLQIEEVMA